MAGRKNRLRAEVEKNPRNCSFEAIERLLKAYGYINRGGSGSHAVFRRAGSLPISVPRRKPVKEQYVKTVLAAIGEIDRSEGPDEDDEEYGFHERH
jgi:hypothetical protein